MGKRYGNYKNRLEIILDEKQIMECISLVKDMSKSKQLRKRAGLFLELNRLRITRDKSVLALCEEIGFSRIAVSKILKKFHKYGFSSLYGGNGRPTGFSALKPNIIRLLKKKPPCGCKYWHPRLIKEKLCLDLSIQTIYNYLKKI